MPHPRPRRPGWRRREASSSEVNGSDCARRRDTPGSGRLGAAARQCSTRPALAAHHLPALEPVQLFRDVIEARPGIPIAVDRLDRPGHVVEPGHERGAAEDAPEGGVKGGEELSRPRAPTEKPGHVDEGGVPPLQRSRVAVRFGRRLSPAHVPVVRSHPHGSCPVPALTCRIHRSRRSRPDTRRSVPSQPGYAYRPGTRHGSSIAPAHCEDGENGPPIRPGHACRAVRPRRS